MEAPPPHKKRRPPGYPDGRRSLEQAYSFLEMRLVARPTATATATTATAAATATVPTATATTTAASAAAGALTRLADSKGATIQLATVESADRCLRIRLGLHLYEGKSTRLARHAIGDDRHVGDLPTVGPKRFT
jgi:hypothetical protein